MSIMAETGSSTIFILINCQHDWIKRELKNENNSSDYRDKKKNHNKRKKGT